MTRRLLRPFSSRLAVGAFALVAVSTVVGCSEMSPQTTQLHYEASDGINGTAGSLGVRNLLLITDSEDAKTANVVGTLVNTGSSALKVDLSTSGGSASVTVPAGGRVALSQSPQVQLPVSQQPGLLTPMAITGGSNELKLQVPLLDGTLPEYSSLTPTVAPSTPSATTTP